MSIKKIFHIGIISLDFDQIARMPDKEVFERQVLVCRLSKKRIVPAKVRYDVFRASRASNSITIHLLFLEKESARAGFVQAPSFNLM